MTRRAVVAGLAVMPFAGAASPAGAAARLGWPDGLGLADALEDRRQAVRLPSVGALCDHLAAGLVERGILPLSTPGANVVPPPFPLPAADAWLLFGPAARRAAPLLARPTADPQADAALKALWRAIGEEDVPELLALPLGPARANVEAGRLAGALLFDAPAAAPPGCRLLHLGRQPCLRPALGIARTAFADA